MVSLQAEGKPVDTKVTPPPLCFVLMPFGRKTDATGRTTDFDAVYQQIIAPAVQEAGLDPIRADEEKIGGTIHKPMFERLMLCDYAVADITGANPNVFYELGIRHAMRPRSTVILFAEGTTLPFDVALLRGIRLSHRRARRAARPEILLRARSRAQLDAARENPHDDSPLFQLLEYMPRFEVDHSKTDIFREQVRLFEEIQGPLLAAAREQGARGGPRGDGRAGACQSARGRGRRRGRSLSLVARRQVLCRHDRAVRPHAAAAAARAHHARAIRLRAQSRRPLAGGGGGAQGGARRSSARRARPTACSAASTRTAGRAPRRRAGSRRGRCCEMRSTPISRDSRPTGAMPIRASTR